MKPFNWKKTWKNTEQQARQKFIEDLRKRFLNRQIKIYCMPRSWGGAWEEIVIFPIAIDWPVWDSNGPTFYTSDKKSYHSHPDYDITIV